MKDTEKFYKTMMELGYSESYSNECRKAAERFLLHTEGKKITIELIGEYTNRRFIRHERRLLFLFFRFINGEKISSKIWQSPIKTSGRAKIGNKQEVLKRFSYHKPLKIPGKIYCYVLYQNIPICQSESCDHFPCLRN